MSADQLFNTVLAVVWAVLIVWYVVGACTGRPIMAARPTWALLALLGLNIMVDCLIRAVG